MAPLTSFADQPASPSPSPGAALPIVAPVVVTATRVLESSQELPVSVDRVDHAQIAAGRLEVNLSESLVEVPGVVAEERQNYAQDLQMSVRGFGARSNFGLSGVRLFADGIPGTMPDGQGQFSHFDIGSADRMEILRGPFSSLYGNSSGGVIAIFTADGTPGLESEADASVGSYGTERYALQAGGDTGQTNYLLSGSHFATSGFRDHSAAERDIINSKVRIELSDGASVTFVANALEMPDAEDPLGLTRAQLTADPTQAGTEAILYNTRKSLNQEQAGVIYARALDAATELNVTTYLGARHTTQYQAILESVELRPTSPGGVVELAREYGGVDAHATRRGDLAGGPYELTIGASYDLLDEGRRGYLNFADGDVGVEGGLRRDLLNRAYDVDEYLEADWDPTPAWHTMAGLRNSLVEISSNDHLAVPGTLAETGVSYAAADPVAGLSYRLAQRLNLYAAYGRGFETPTLNNLAYRSTDGSIPGLNLGLRPARSDNYELGIKASGDAWRGSLATFYVSTHDELAVESSSGGRSVYENIDRTDRRGIELAMEVQPATDIDVRLAYTYLRAVVDDPYLTCETLPCHPVVIAAGNRLPAVPANSLYAGLRWSNLPHGLVLTAEAIGRASVYVDDRNSDAADGYWVSNVSAALEQRGADWRVTETARVDNVFARNYVGSVIVNDSNGRFFEPEPGRTAYLTVRVNYR
jgi:iron complex outermembrane receptor protein